MFVNSSLLFYHVLDRRLCVDDAALMYYTVDELIDYRCKVENGNSTLPSSLMRMTFRRKWASSPLELTRSKYYHPSSSTPSAHNDWNSFHCSLSPSRWPNPVELPMKLVSQLLLCALLSEKELKLFTLPARWWRWCLCLAKPIFVLSLCNYTLLRCWCCIFYLELSLVGVAAPLSSECSRSLEENNVSPNHSRRFNECCRFSYRRLLLKDLWASSCWSLLLIVLMLLHSLELLNDEKSSLSDDVY